MFNTVKMDLFIDLLSLNQNLDFDDIPNEINNHMIIKREHYYDILNFNGDLSAQEQEDLNTIVLLYRGKKNKSSIERMCELFLILLLSSQYSVNLGKILRESVFAYYDHNDLMQKIGRYCGISPTDFLLFDEIRNSAGIDAASIVLQDVSEVLESNFQKASWKLLSTVESLVSYYGCLPAEMFTPEEVLGMTFGCMVHMIFLADSNFTVSYVSSLMKCIFCLQQKHKFIFDLLAEYGFYVDELLFLYHKNSLQDVRGIHGW